MAAHRAPKQWMLTKNETITSFESWKQNLAYVLSLDEKFTPYLGKDVTWQKKTNANQHRGFTNDAAEANNGQTAAQKSATLDLMLGQIANFCPVIARNSIIKSSTSLSNIWQAIRQHFGFQSSGAHFLDLAAIKLELDERPEDLFQRIVAFFEDNLLTTAGGISHHGIAPTEDEDMTPSIENTIVVLWLQLINPGLPQLVKQKYGAELRNKSLASIKPEISQALNSLLEELKSIEESKVFRAAAPSKHYNSRPRTNSRPGTKSCILCKTAGRSTYNTHYLSTCKFLPAEDRRALGKSRLVQEEYSDDDLSSEPTMDDHLQQSVTVENALIDPTSTRRVSIVQSPYLNVFYKHHPVRLTIDTGATTNMVKASFARYIHLPITPASQMACQADGVTPLNVVGEVHTSFTRGDSSFQLDALVVEQLDVDVLAGNPFLVANDIATRPAKRQIVIRGSEVLQTLI